MNSGGLLLFLNYYKDVTTDLGRLIHDFGCSRAQDMLCEPISDITRKLKSSGKGRNQMCKAVEKYGLRQEQKGLEQGLEQGRSEERLRTIKEFIKNKMLSFEQISEAFKIPIEEVSEIASQMS